MDIFDVLTMICGLCLFLFGMNIMGESLERRAGGEEFDRAYNAFSAKHPLGE